MASDICQQLIDRGLIGPDQLTEAEGVASAQGIRAEDALVKLGYVEESDISSLQAQEFGYDSINLDSTDIPQAVIALVPESVARENVVLPLRMDGDSIVVAINDPMKFEVIDKLAIIGNFGNGKVSTIDGVRVDFDDGWGLVRASNTTPCLTFRCDQTNGGGAWNPETLRFVHSDVPHQVSCYLVPWQKALRVQRPL